VLLAPADGRVLLVEPAEAPCWDLGPAWRVAIFLSLWDVHVQRAPAAGRVAFSQPQAGGYRPAMQDGAAGNAGHWLGVETAYGPLLVLRTAGLAARRVTTSVSLGQDLRAGQRIGRILLGSRTEVYLPRSARVLVRPGQHVRAGESVLAAWAEPGPG
jgi:phosphatidylserine decarboxylase